MYEKIDKIHVAQQMFFNILKIVDFITLNNE